MHRYSSHPLSSSFCIHLVNKQHEGIFVIVFGAPTSLNVLLGGLKHRVCCSLCCCPHTRTSVPSISSHSCLLTIFNKTKLGHCRRCTVVARLLSECGGKLQNPKVLLPVLMYAFVTVWFAVCMYVGFGFTCGERSSAPVHIGAAFLRHQRLLPDVKIAQVSSAAE